MVHAQSAGIAVLCYHDLQPVARNEMTNTPANFEAHLAWLKQHHYETLSIEDLVAVMRGTKAAPKKAIVLTFDDGYEGVYRYGYPLLKKYGYRATLFAVTSVMGDERQPMPHLTWNQITEMDRSGVIEAEVHAYRMHVKMGKLLLSEKPAQKGEDIALDLRRARRDIEAHTGHKAFYLAWPYGDYNFALIRLAAKEGYDAMLDTEYGINKPGGDVTRIKRLRMSSKYDVVQRFESKLAHYGLR